MGSLGSQLDDAQASALAVAVTATYSQMAFAKTLEVGFPLLSDWDGQVADAYDVRYDTWKGHRGVAKRAVFVIDSTARVVYRWVTDDAEMLPDLGEAMAVIAAL